MSPCGVVGEWEAGRRAGKTSYQSCLAILLAMEREERAIRSQQMAKYRDTRRWKWFLPAAGDPSVPSPRGVTRMLGTRVRWLSKGHTVLH